MAKLTVDIPDRLVSQVESAGQSVEAVLLKAFTKYVDDELPKRDITKTRTWELRGSFAVAEPEAKGSEAVETNYAEHIDDVLYKGL